jgi:hypothetical protein
MNVLRQSVGSVDFLCTVDLRLATLALERETGPVWGRLARSGARCNTSNVIDGRDAPRSGVTAFRQS